MSKYLFIYFFKKKPQVQNIPNFSIPKSLDLRNKHKKKSIKKRNAPYIFYLFMKRMRVGDPMDFGKKQIDL
jgi:hypothetical protein